MIKKRARWKGPNIYPKTKNINLGKNNYQVLKINRNAEITPNHVGLEFKVHNGKGFLKVLVTKDMIGHKLGEFSPTRGTFTFKKTKKRPKH